MAFTPEELATIKQFKATKAETSVQTTPKPVEIAPTLPTVEPSRFEKFQEFAKTQSPPEPTQFERVERLGEIEQKTQGFQNSTASLLGLKPTQLRTGSPEFKEALAERTPEQPTVLGAVKETAKTFGEAVTNIPASAGQLAKDIGTAIINPIETAKSIGGLGLGLIQKLIPGEQESEKLVNALADNYKERFGDLESIRQTFIDDPVGFMSDTAFLLLGSGAAIKGVGAISRLEQISKFGGGVLKTSAKVDPIATVGRGIQKITPEISISPFGKSVDKEVVSLAKKRGIDLPAAAATRSKTVQRIQALFGSEKFQGSISKARESLNKQFDKLSEVIPETSLKAVGESVKEGFDNFKAEFRKKSQELYGAVPDDIKKIVADTSSTKSALESLTKKAKKSLTTREGQSRFNEILKELKPKEGKILTGVGDQKFKINPKIAYERLLQTRKDVGKLLANRADPITTGLKSELERLYASLSDDLNKTLTNNAPEALEQLNKANKFFGEQINKINSTVGKKIKNVEASQIANSLIKKNTPEAIKSIKEMVGAEGVEHLQTSLIADTLNKSINRRTGFIDGKKIKTQIERLGRETVEELLTPEQLKSLDKVTAEASNLERIQKAISRGESVAQGSQTTFTAKISALFSGVGIAAFTNPQLFVGLIGAIITDKLAGRFFNSVTGQKLLTEGLKTTPKVGEKIQKVAIPAQILRQEEKIK